VAKEKMFVSFSGGRTSAYMSWWLKANMSDKYEFVFLFANTGQEHEETLKFVQRCDEAFALNLVWVEAKVHHGERRGTTHKIVDFNSACRKGAPFEEMIKKYGIPNTSYPHCTRELKLNPMYSFINEVWPERDYLVAVGIRSDEQKRRRKDAEKAKIVYPLMDWNPVDKQDVNSWWEEQSFNLQLEEYEGNCVWCWKKTDRKHFLNLSRNVTRYAFPDRMEQLYGQSGSGDQSRVFFRQNRSTRNLIGQLQLMNPDTRMGSRDDEDAGCSESCEAFGAVECGGVECGGCDLIGTLRSSGEGDSHIVDYDAMALDPLI
jgi:hypothetical protein